MGIFESMLGARFAKERRARFFPCSSVMQERLSAHAEAGNAEYMPLLSFSRVFAASFAIEATQPDLQ